MAVKKACLVQNAVQNTGKECDAAPVAPAMIIAVPPDFTFTDTDMLDPDSWLNTAIHAAVGQRAYPLFGQNSPITDVTNDNGTDVTVELGNGLKVFLRYALYNRTLETISGGLCYAKALQSFNKSGMRIIEIDQQGQILCRLNADGTYGGLIIPFMYSPSPIMPDFKNTPWKARFQYSLDPTELVTNGILLAGASSLLDVMGLIDAKPVNVSTTQTTTTIFFGFETECTQKDLVASEAANLGTHINNFIVKNKATGVVITPSAAAIVSGQIRLTGVFATGQTFTVTGAAPSVWLSNGVDGYDGSGTSIDIVIP